MCQLAQRGFKSQKLKSASLAVLIYLFESCAKRILCRFFTSHLSTRRLVHMLPPSSPVCRICLSLLYISCIKKRHLLPSLYIYKNFSKNLQKLSNSVPFCPGGIQKCAFAAKLCRKMRYICYFSEVNKGRRKAGKMVLSGYVNKKYAGKKKAPAGSCQRKPQWYVILS